MLLYRDKQSQVIDSVWTYPEVMETSGVLRKAATLGAVSGLWKEDVTMQQRGTNLVVASKGTHRDPPNGMNYFDFDPITPEQRSTGFYFRMLGIRILNNSDWAPFRVLDACRATVRMILSFQLKARAATSFASPKSDLFD
ncbi:MAG: hypothetical protein L6R38_004358 [Xanthoria sp. 2 TBL-2021]|nr:MAG: hypothetical protein L6R38_004358 [Xanthoria sp. 2 TBL-2021]